MGHPEPVTRMSYVEYSLAERSSELKHEFLDAQVWARAGGTPEHGALAMAFGGELGNALHGRPCRVFSSDVRVRVRETGLVTYPDLSVVCGRLETDTEDADTIVNPVLLVEILSPSTEGYDRGDKAAHYRRIPSLVEYVLVSQSEHRIEVYRRNALGRWELSDARAGESFELVSVGVTLSVDAIYADPLAEASTG
jgi:Uma2 family endonuclease